MRTLKLFIFLPGLLSALAAQAGGAGTSGAEFLRIVQSPRAAAMGDSGAGGYGDLLSAVALNPASLGKTAFKEAAFVHNAWLEGINSQQAVYAHPTSRGVAAVSISAMNYPEISAYDNSGASAGTVDADDLAVGVSYAARLRGPDDRNSGLFAGATLKYARETLAGVSAAAALGDIGALWVARRPKGAFALGVSAQSLGGGFKFDSRTDAPPTTLRAGASYIAMAGGDPLTFSADIRRARGSVPGVSAGVEYQPWRTLSVRAGYASWQDLGRGLRFGGGVAVKLMRFDYSLSSYGKFGPTHLFSFSYKFNKPVVVTPHFSYEQEKARTLTGRASAMMAEKRYYEAVLLLNDALTLDPGYAEALELMRKARRLLGEVR